MPTVVILARTTIAAYFDVRWRRVPNWLVVATIAVSVGWHAVVNGAMGILVSLAGLALGVCMLFPLYLLRGMGAGDVKFFGALGAGVTHKHLLMIFILSILVSGALALLVVLRKGVLGGTIARTKDLISGLLRGRLRPHPEISIDHGTALLVPFTAAVAIATWIYVVWRVV